MEQALLVMECAAPIQIFAVLITAGVVVLQNIVQTTAEVGRLALGPAPILCIAVHNMVIGKLSK